MPLITVLSHSNAPEEQRLPNHPRSALLWSVLPYVKQCADDKDDLVTLARHPAAWKTHKLERGHTRTHTQSNADSHQSHALFFLSLSLSPTHKHTRTHSTSVRGPHVSQSFIQTQLRLLHAAIITRWTRGKHIKSAFSLAHCTPSC